jgi:hypothetical protein
MTRRPPDALPRPPHDPIWALAISWALLSAPVYFALQGAWSAALVAFAVNGVAIAVLVWSLGALSPRRRRGGRPDVASDRAGARHPRL